jgi:DNA repair photolyase
VRQSPIGLFRKQEWGTWIDVKQEVKEKIIKEIGNLKKKNKQVTIFMSSSTDPYQPIEYKEKITRSLLEGMIAMPPDFLFIQTRSPLVTRDIDLLLQLKNRLRISMTVETDNEFIRKKFSPFAPPIQARLKAISQLRDNHLPVQIAVAPVLPFSKKFPETLSKVVDRIVIDDFYTGDGSHGKRTEKLRIKELYDEKDVEMWYGENTHLLTMEKLKEHFTADQILISQEGFKPY